MKIILCVLMLMSVAILTQTHEVPLPLYPNGVPNAKPVPATYIEKNNNGLVGCASIPTITPYLPANGTAILIFPGGINSVKR
jgi:hypothetical protein